jgi:hypothetical protein
MDLSKLSDSDLMALQSGDLSKVSFQGLSAISNQTKAQGRAQREAAQLEQDKKLYDPTAGMSGTDKFLAGAGKAMSDLAMGARQYLPESLGGVSNEQIEERRKLDAPLMQTGAGQAGNVVGNVAMAAPSMLIPGANLLRGGIAIGAGTGALQPGVDAAERLKNIGIGAVAGGVVPGAITAAKTAKSFVEPFYQGGREQILGRALNTAAGGESATAIKNLQSAGELVPGSMPTVGEAANVPSLAAMQRASIATTPTATNQLSARQLSQNEARVNALRGLSPDRVSAVASREAATNALYDTAKKGTVQLTEDLSALMNRPSMKSAMTRAQSLAKEAGEDLNFVKELPASAGLLVDASGKPLTQTAAKAGSMSGKAAHYLKMALDDMSNASPATGISGNELRAIQGTKADYLAALEKQLPEYGQARTTYANMSKPVTQADILAEVEKKATNMRGDITPAAFSRATSDKVAQAVTGRPTATMAGSMSPDQMKTIQAIQADLLRSDFANTAGRGVGSNTVQNLAYGNMMNQAGIPSSIRNFGPAGVVGNVAQRFGQIAYKDANQRLTEELAETMLNPQRAAQLMQAGQISPQTAQIVNALRRGGTAIGAATPGMVQANQQ